MQEIFQLLAEEPAAVNRKALQSRLDRKLAQLEGRIKEALNKAARDKSVAARAKIFTACSVPTGACRKLPSHLPELPAGSTGNPGTKKGFELLN